MASVRPRDVHQLVNLVYESALHEERWPDFLAHLTRVLRAEMPGITAASREGVEVLASFGTDQGFVEMMIEHYGATVVRSVIAERAVGRAVDLDEVSPVPLDRWEYFVDWVKPQHMRYSIAVFALDARWQGFTCGVYRPPHHRPFARDELEVLDLLAPHLSRAFELRDRLRTLGSERDAAALALDQLGVGLVLLGARGRLLAANRIAEGLAGDGLSLAPDGVHAADRFAERELQRLVREAARTAQGSGLGAGGALRVPRPSGKRPFELLVTPLAPEGLRLGVEVAAVAIFLTDPERASRSNEEVLRTLYGLTAAESRLAARLARGEKLEEVASELGIRPGTARNQLKAVFAKTETHRQSELVARLLASPARLAGGGKTGRDS